MAFRKAAGAAPRGDDAHDFRSLGRRIEDRDSATRLARQALDDLVANGAEPTYRAAEGMLPASFVYELKAGGDRQCCRRIIASAKGDPLLWAALVREIGARSGGAA